MNNCLNCKHWNGPKKKQRRAIEKYTDIVMHLKKGWPEQGCCMLSDLWISVKVDGDACTTLTVNANHCCNRWESDHAIHIQTSWNNGEDE